MGAGGTLILSYIHRLGSFFGVQNFNPTILRVFRKIYFFWGMKILWIFFEVITKLDGWIDVRTNRWTDRQTDR